MIHSSIIIVYMILYSIQWQSKKNKTLYRALTRWVYTNTHITVYDTYRLQYTATVFQLRFKVPWFQRFVFIIFIAKGGGKINLWLKAAIDSSSRANQFELGSDPDSVS